MTEVTGLLRSLQDRLESSLRSVRQLLNEASEPEDGTDMLDSLRALNQEAQDWNARIGQLALVRGAEKVAKQAQAPRRSSRRMTRSSGGEKVAGAVRASVVPAGAVPVEHAAHVEPKERSRRTARVQRKKRTRTPEKEEGDEMEEEAPDIRKKRGKERRDDDDQDDQDDNVDEEVTNSRKQRKAIQKTTSTTQSVIGDGMPGRTRDGVLVYFTLLDELPAVLEEQRSGTSSTSIRRGKRGGNMKMKKQWTCPSRTSDDDQIGALVVERNELQQVSLDCLAGGDREWYFSQVETDIVRRFHVNFPILFANAGKEILSVRNVLIGDGEVGRMGVTGRERDGEGAMVAVGASPVGVPSVATTNGVLEALKDRMGQEMLVKQTSPWLSSVNNIVLMVAASIHARMSLSGAPDWHDAYLEELQALSKLCSLTANTIKRYRSVGTLMLRSPVIACMLPSFVSRLEDPIALLLNDEQTLQRLETACFAKFPALVMNGGSVGGSVGGVEYLELEMPGGGGDGEPRLLNAPPPLMPIFDLQEGNADVQEERTLDLDGFQVYKGAYEIDAFTRSAFESIPLELFHLIFNNAPASSEENDGKRLQLDLNTIGTSSTTFHQFMGGLKTRLRELVPNFRVGGASVLRSEPGCQAQLPHLDYPPPPPENASLDVPLGCLVALMDVTRITVWPGAIGYELHGSGLGIQPRTLVLNAGDLLLFRGDLVHAGASAEEMNVRVHCYLEPADGSFQRQLEPDGTEVTHFTFV